jgi:flavorubredoxin
MVRKLEIEQIVPQHGNRFIGRKAVKDFIDWIEQLECGVDLMGQNNYQLPVRLI